MIKKQKIVASARFREKCQFSFKKIENHLQNRRALLTSQLIIMTQSNDTTPVYKKLSGTYEDPKQVPAKEWRKVLTDEQFNITRESGTEPKFTGAYDKHFEPGKYVCLCCGADLFVSDSKYNSGCGWPAFSESVGKDKNIVRLPDLSRGRVRTEVRCSQCDAHLGHVFQDGPQETTGERYCINSAAIDFVPKPDVLSQPQ